MNDLEQIIQKSRYIQVAKRGNLFTIDANCWIESQHLYTINLRGSGETLDNAAQCILNKMNTHKVVSKHNE